MIQAVTARMLVAAEQRFSVDFFESEALPQGLLVVGTVALSALLAAYGAAPVLLWGVGAVARRPGLRERLVIAVLGITVIMASSLVGS